MIPYEAGVQELQVSRTAFGSSHQRCYQEGRYLPYVSCIHFVSEFNHSLGVFSLDRAHGQEGMELGLSCQEKCTS